MQSQLKRRIAFGVTTGGLLAGGGLGFAHADSGAGTAGATGGTGNSPGVLSGNSVQIPIDIPINICGVTANVIGLLNPAAGNDCSNSGGATASTGGPTAGARTGGATAQGGTSNSPGVLSGNNVQVPVHVPVNVCGDALTVIGAKNSATGNHCANDASGPHTSGGATAHGGTSNSPGVLSGNNVQVPIDVPVNVCGDSVSVIGLLDSAKHNGCANGTPGTPTTPGTPCPPPTSGSTLPPPPGHSTPPSTHPSTPPTSGSTTPGGPTSPGGSTSPGGPQGSATPGVLGETTPAGSTGSLAHTGSDALMLAPVGAAMVGGGVVLYRKFKPGGTH